MEDFLHSEGLLNRLFSQRVITGRCFSRLYPKATSAVFCKDGFGDGYHLVIRVDLGWAKTLCRKGFRLFGGHSHSILAGGLVVTSSTTRFTCGTSLTILAEIVRTTSYGMRAQSAVMKSSVVTARMATV